MRIGFDISQTGFSRTGTGFFADGMVRALVAQDGRHQWDLYTNFGTDFWDPDHARATTRIQGVRYWKVAASHREAIDFWGRSLAAIEADLEFPDIIHSNNFYCPEERGNARKVYTLYDLVPFEHPELLTEANRLVCTKGLFNAALYADLILAISNHTRSHFLDIFPHFPAERIHVVYPASRFSAAGTGKRAAQLSAGSFWLAVGTLEPRKNLRFLLEVYAGMRRDGLTDRLLVLAGGEGWMEDDLSSYIRSLGIESDVLLTGYIADEQLRWLYANCYAFVYPSLFEGFGMPVLEAMGLGAAVITSSQSSLPEVIGEAGQTVDPQSPAALAEAMLRFENDADFLAACRSRSIDRAKLFTWERSAAQVLALYETLAGD